ncbi:MAG: sugar phosphate isomerase/epimerase [Burkholderiales bacterium]|nr:sugar phosphate isomerase/epimerase [Anaerolineae bacterium]
MALRFAYSTINWGTKCDLAAMFGEIRDAGWEAVELFDHSLDWMGTPDNLRQLLGGLKVATFFGGLEVPVSAESLNIHKRRMEYAALFDTEQYGLVGGGRLRMRPPNEAEYSNLAAACEELAEHGAGLGIEIGYHPHTACTIETEEEIDILLAKTQKTQLCLDVSHIALVDEDPVTQLAKYKARTSYVHMKDWAKGKFVELGEGSVGIDFPTILAWLDEQQSSGWIVIENSRSDISPAHSAQFNADYIRKLGYSLNLAEGVAR